MQLYRRFSSIWNTGVCSSSRNTANCFFVDTVEIYRPGGIVRNISENINFKFYRRIRHIPVTEQHLFFFYLRGKAKRV